MLAEQVRAVTSAVSTAAVDAERRHTELRTDMQLLAANGATKAGDGEAGPGAWVRSNPVVALGAMATGAMIFLLLLSFMADIMRGQNDTDALLKRLDRIEGTDAAGMLDETDPADE